MLSMVSSLRLYSPNNVPTFAVDREGIIKVTQGLNGCLLSVFSSLLFLCINDLKYMEKGPQKGWANFRLLTSVLVTIFLAGFTVFFLALTSGQKEGEELPADYLWVSLGLAGCCAVAGLAGLGKATGLWGKIGDYLKMRFFG